MIERLWDIYQVTAFMTEKANSDREIVPLRAISDNYPREILTLDRFTVGNYDGIMVVNVIDWLFELDMECTCPYAGDGENCKHMAAVLYAWEQGGSRKNASSKEAQRGHGKQAIHGGQRYP